MANEKTYFGNHGHFKWWFEIYNQKCHIKTNGYIENSSYSDTDTNLYSIWVNGFENSDEAFKYFLYVSLPEIGNIGLG